MKRVAALTVALLGLIFVRATSAAYVPVWSPMWFVWIIATCAIAWCGGWAHREVHERRDRERRPRL